MLPDHEKKYFGFIQSHRKLGFFCTYYVQVDTDPFILPHQMRHFFQAGTVYRRLSCLFQRKVCIQSSLLYSCLSQQHFIGLHLDSESYKLTLTIDIDLKVSFGYSTLDRAHALYWTRGGPMHHRSQQRYTTEPLEGISIWLHTKGVAASTLVQPTINEQTVF